MSGSAHRLPVIVGTAVIAVTGGFVGCSVDQAFRVGPAGLGVAALLWLGLYGIGGVRDADSGADLAVAASALALVLLTTLATLVWASPELSMPLHLRCGTGLMAAFIIGGPVLAVALCALGLGAGVMGHALASLPGVVRIGSYALFASGAALVATGLLRAERFPTESNYVDSLPVTARVHLQERGPLDADHSVALAHELGIGRCDARCVDWVQLLTRELEGVESPWIVLRRDVRHGFGFFETPRGRYAAGMSRFDEREIHGADIADGVAPSHWELFIGFAALGIAGCFVIASGRQWRALRVVSAASTGVCEGGWLTLDSDATEPMPVDTAIPDGPVLVSMQSSRPERSPYRGPLRRWSRVWSGTRSDVVAAVRARATRLDSVACVFAAVGCAPLFARSLWIWAGN